MLTVNFYGGHPPLTFPMDSDQCIEDIIIASAQVLEINPLCRHLFGLRDTGKRLWAPLCKKIVSFPKNTTLQFRLRFKAHSLKRLKCLDEKAFEYYFYQVRSDFVAGEINELITNQEDGLGLVVVDVLLHLINNPGKKVGDVELKNFMPKELNRMANRHNVKKETEKHIDTTQRKDPAYIRECYLSSVEEKRNTYGAEEYYPQMDEAGNVLQIRICIDPFHPTLPGLRYCYASQKRGPWTHLCRLEELVFVSMRSQDLTVEVSRATGVPCYFKFQALDVLESFVSSLSGYYRLLRTWTFDLCRELSTPSLEFLRSNKCHGPIGSVYSVRKLKEKGGGFVGVALLRESVSDYNSFKLDITVHADKPPVTHTVLKQGGQVCIKDKDRTYSSIAVMLKELCKSEDPTLKITRILPPSDYDNAEPLLLSASQDKNIQSNNQTGPMVISMDHLTSSESKIIRGKFSNVYVAQWSTKDNTEVAVKMPKLNDVGDSDRLLVMMNEVAFVNCECIVSILGVTLTPLALVMEYLPLGPLDKYLQAQRVHMREVELVEAATYLARALWYLNMEGIQHNKIRCHNVLVANHTEQTFKVKLGDPGLVTYTEQDIHWIPREHHAQPSLAVNNNTTDIWAFSTTLWQIFSFGVSPLPGADMEEVRQLYATGRLLPRPDHCPQELYKVMLRCWSPDPQARRQPQAIMRDVNQILYQVFNSRKNHAYQTIYPANSSGEETEFQNRHLDEESVDYNASITTQLTTLTQSDGSVSTVTVSQLSSVDDLISLDFPICNIPSYGVYNEEVLPPEETTPVTVKKLSEMLLMPKEAMRTPENSALPPRPVMTGKAELELGMPIGQGNYGKVFRGVLKYPEGKTETVAVKTLHTIGDIEDLKREFTMMKKLKHKNIVQLCSDLVETENGEKVYMVMEYLPLGSVRSHIIENKERMTTALLLKFAMDIAEGMDYLEQYRIIHRDLAARNILVKDANTVKISDFGLAQEPNKGNYYIRKTQRSLPIAWYALECIESGKFSHKSDVWSYGVTCWEMFTHGLEPNLPQKPEILIQALKVGRRLTCTPPCKPNIYTKLIRRCWDDEPAERPNFSELMSIIRELQEECL
ncbi:tyrosine-protein kinase hopscotch [Macrobrachium rosenbergii]|uniref:tyrosine-protein kinase hopscotch n=1 Tax=Macrobrachium rosenbergii TaxID=79674 RepID=UPI0034D427C9